MEHGVALVRYVFALLYAACMLLAMPAVHADELSIVIVTSADSNIKSISAKEARRAYLGASIVVDGTEIKPLINETDQLAQEVFLQKVLFMSGDAYKRLLLARAFRGGSHLYAYRNIRELVAALQQDHAAISFMLHETADNTPGMRIISSP